MIGPQVPDFDLYHASWAPKGKQGDTPAAVYAEKGEYFVARRIPALQQAHHCHTVSDVAQLSGMKLLAYLLV